MSENTQDDVSLKDARKKEKIEKEIQDTRDKIFETLRNRKKFEKDYGKTIKKLKEYWESQLDNVDPKKDKNRYNEIKKNIEREKNVLKQIEEELNKINQEIKMEKEHKKRF